MAKSRVWTWAVVGLLMVIIMVGVVYSVLSRRYEQSCGARNLMVLYGDLLGVLSDNAHRPEFLRYISKGGDPLEWLAQRWEGPGNVFQPEEIFVYPPDRPFFAFLFGVHRSPARHLRAEEISYATWAWDNMTLKVVYDDARAPVIWEKRSRSAGKRWVVRSPGGGPDQLDEAEFQDIMNRMRNKLHEYRALQRSGTDP